MKIFCDKILSTIKTGCAYVDLQVAFAQKLFLKNGPRDLVENITWIPIPHGICDVINFSKGDDITMEILV